MGKYYEYPSYVGLTDGTEIFIAHKGGLDYSPTIANIAVGSLGDVDVTGILDGDALIWSDANQKFEVTPLTAGNPFNQDLNTTDTPTFARIIELGVIGLDNVSIGTNSGLEAVSGTDNVYIGQETGHYNDGYSNVSMGYQAGMGQTGSTWYASNVFIGRAAAQIWNAGDENVIMGHYAGAQTTADSNSNVVIGSYAGGGSTDMGDANIIIGLTAGQNAEGGLNNIFIGEMAGLNMWDGTRNVAIGYQCGDGNSVAGVGTRSNVLIGEACGQEIRAGADHNVLLGFYPGQYLNDGANNVLIGEKCGLGVQNISSYNYNVLIGFEAGRVMRTGQYNVCIGYQTGDSLTSAENNIILGSGAGTTLATGTNNILLGENADLADTAATYKCMIGGTAGDAVQVGIGTNAPTYPLDVVGDIQCSGNFRGDGSLLTNLPSSGHIVQEEGSPLTQRANLNFVGTSVTVTDGGAGPDSTIVTITDAVVDLTAVTTDIIGDTTETYDLGSLTYEFKDLHLSGAVFKSGTELTPIVASDTEPTDTSIFWIDTSV